MPGISSRRKLADLFKYSGIPWRYRSEYLLQHLLRVQVHNARRNITPKHFWRYRGSGNVPVFREGPTLKKQYFSPIGAFLWLSHSPGKEMTAAMVESQDDQTITVDLAECIRLGEHFDIDDPKLEYQFYLPRAGDIYQWNFSLYQISDIAPKSAGWYEPLQRYVVWEGKANLLRTDSADVARPVTPLSDEPTIVEGSY